MAWLDHNLNGTFEPGEAVSVLVPSSSQQQYVTLQWNGINVPATANLRTFLRLRVTSTSNNMTAANANGWYNNGEVEDYSVVLGTILSKEDAPSVIRDTVSLAGKIWPNPAADFVTIQVTASDAGEAGIQLFNNTGQLVRTYQRSINAGTNNLRLNNLGALPKGVYTVRITMNTSAMLSKLVIGS